MKRRDDCPTLIYDFAQCLGTISYSKPKPLHVQPEASTGTLTEILRQPPPPPPRRPLLLPPDSWLTGAHLESPWPRVLPRALDVTCVV